MSYKRITLIVGERIETAKGVLSDWIFLEDCPDKIYNKQRTTYKRVVKCRCVCGIINDVQYCNIRTGKSLSCNKGSCRIAPNIGNGTAQTSYNMLYDNYKRGAKKRNLEFSISIEYFKELTLQKCYYCGNSPYQIFRILNSKTKRVRAGIPIKYNGIDRVDNNVGYTTSNCIPCCGICNIAKSSKTQLEFLSWIKKVYNNLNL